MIGRVSMLHHRHCVNLSCCWCVWLLKKQIKHEWELLLFLTVSGKKSFKGKKSKPQLHYTSWKWAISFLVSIPNNLHVNIQRCAIQGLFSTLGHCGVSWTELQPEKGLLWGSLLLIVIPNVQRCILLLGSSPYSLLALRSESSCYFLCSYIILISFSPHSLGCRYIQRQWPWSVPLGMVAWTTGSLGVWLVVMRSGLHAAFAFLDA